MGPQGELKRRTRPGIARGPQNPIGGGRLTLIGHPQKHDILTLRLPAKVRNAVETRPSRHHWQGPEVCRVSDAGDPRGPWRRGRRPKASRERTRGMKSAVRSLWGFSVCAWSAAVEVMRPAEGNDDVDERVSRTGAAHAATWWLQGGRFWRVGLQRGVLVGAGARSRRSGDDEVPRQGCAVVGGLPSWHSGSACRAR
jgi:hypothetical protein